MLRLVPVLALLALISPALAYTNQAEVNEAWPMCSDTPYRIEPWQVIEPDHLTAIRAERALEWLAEHQDDEQIRGEALMILTLSTQILEGYALRMRMRHGVRRSGRDAREDFCQWITTTSFPE
ncbi:hypothetical protein PC39_14197 [Salinisphaera sp. PC39]|uniref:hypothetical protein n=1 Tax=Salinisphaera sp. PC39 TaxID=1304156 RepID=UPI00333FA561